MRSSIVSSGRRRRSAAEVSAVLERYRGSGLTQAAFAEEVGIGISTLSLWLRRARKSREERGESPGQLVAVRVSDASGVDSQLGERDGFELRFPSGVSVAIPQVFDGDALRRLLSVVSATC